MSTSPKRTGRGVAALIPSVNEPIAIKSTDLIAMRLAAVEILLAELVEQGRARREMTLPELEASLSSNESVSFSAVLSCGHAHRTRTSVLCGQCADERPGGFGNEHMREIVKYNRHVSDPAARATGTVESWNDQGPPPSPDTAPTRGALPDALPTAPLPVPAAEALRGSPGSRVICHLQHGGVKAGTLRSLDGSVAEVQIDGAGTWKGEAWMEMPEGWSK